MIFLKPCIILTLLRFFLTNLVVTTNFGPLLDRYIEAFRRISTVLLNYEIFFWYFKNETPESIDHWYDDY